MQYRLAVNFGTLRSQEFVHICTFPLVRKIEINSVEWSSSYWLFYNTQYILSTFDLKYQKKVFNLLVPFKDD